MFVIEVLRTTVKAIDTLVDKKGSRWTRERQVLPIINQHLTNLSQHLVILPKTPSEFSPNSLVTLRPVISERALHSVLQY